MNKTRQETLDTGKKKLFSPPVTTPSLALKGVVRGEKRYPIARRGSPVSRFSRRYLDGYGWSRLNVGSSLVTFCHKCRRQRTHTCVAKNWEEDDWVYDFECDHCTYDAISAKFMQADKYRKKGSDLP